MKIIIENDTMNIVRYYDDAVTITLDPNGQSSPILDANIKSTTHTVIPDVPVIENWGEVPMRYVDGEVITFFPAPSTPTVTYSKSMTPIRFKLLLGQSARLAIRNAVAYSGADEAELTKKAILSDWWEILNDPTLVAVNVEDPDTIDAIGYLVLIGIITEEKQNEILLGYQNS